MNYSIPLIIASISILKLRGSIIIDVETLIWKRGRNVKLALIFQFSYFLQLKKSFVNSSLE